MTVEPSIHRPVASPRERVVQRSHARTALLVGAMWLIVAVGLNAAGETALGVCFAAVGVLWIWIAAIENQDQRRHSTVRKVRPQVRWQAAPSVS